MKLNSCIRFAVGWDVLCFPPQIGERAKTQNVQTMATQRTLKVSTKSVAVYTTTIMIQNDVMI